MVIGSACADVPSSVRPGRMLPSPYRRNSRAAVSTAAAHSSGSVNRSNRLAASEKSLCLRAVRLIEAGSQCAASSSTSVLSVRISVLAPPIVPASEITPVSSAITTSSGSRFRSASSSVTNVSPGSARRITRSPLIAPVSKACSGWPSSSIT